MNRLRAWPWQRVLTLGISIKSRIIIGTIFPIAAICLYFLHTLNTEKQVALTTHEILDHRIVMMHEAERIKQALVSYDDALFRYLAVQDPDLLTEGQRRKREAQENLAFLRRHSSSPVLGARLELLQTESEQYFIDAEQLLEYARTTRVALNVLQERSSAWNRGKGREHLELAFLSAEGRARLVRVFSLCEEILTVNLLELERAQTDMDTLLLQARRAGLVLSLLATGVLGILAAGFILSLLSPLRNLLAGIHQMQEGDLNVEIPVTTDDEVGELTRAFNHAARIIHQQRAQLLQETITDGLTGAYNQRHFRRLLRQEMERARRSGSAVSLLMIDVDHFKEYNDVYGHEFGNTVLKAVSELIRETVREVDILARYGGDEFSVLLPQADPGHARMTAQRILDSVSASGFLKTRVAGAERKLSVSIGGASYPTDGSSAEVLIHRADAALYAAKSAGRARACWASLEGGDAGALEVVPH